MFGFKSTDEVTLFLQFYYNRNTYEAIVPILFRVIQFDHYLKSIFWYRKSEKWASQVGLVLGRKGKKANSQKMKR